jgi:hypothetical protein
MSNSPGSNIQDSVYSHQFDIVTSNPDLLLQETISQQMLLTTGISRTVSHIITEALMNTLPSNCSYPRELVNSTNCGVMCDAAQPNIQDTYAVNGG